MKLEELFEAELRHDLPGRFSSTSHVEPEHSDPGDVVPRGRSNVVLRGAERDVVTVIQSLISTVRELRRLGKQIPLERQYQLRALIDMLPRFPHRPADDWQDKQRQQHGLTGDVKDLYGYV